MGAGRMRGIKPQFFQNETLADLSPHARLAFIGLWIYADREGRLEDRPMRLRIQILPYEPDQDMHTLLQQLHDAGFVKRYTVGSEHYLQVVNFTKHQRPNHREAPSVIPAFSDGCAAASTTKTRRFLGKAMSSPGKVSDSVHASRRCPSESESETETDTEEEKSKNPPVGPPTNSHGRKCKLPVDFELSPEREDFALKAGVVDPHREFALFTDHWRATGKPMKDWEATWRNWCRNAAPGGRFATRPASGASDPRLHQSLEEMAAEIEETRRRQRKAANSDDGPF